ncbi:hypothetical protein ACFL7M_11635 [Thermodesulfobacteriota bacterium]
MSQDRFHESNKAIIVSPAFTSGVFEKVQGFFRSSLFDGFGSQIPGRDRKFTNATRHRLVGVRDLRVPHPDSPSGNSRTSKVPEGPQCLYAMTPTPAGVWSLPPHTKLLPSAFGIASGPASHFFEAQ